MDERIRGTNPSDYETELTGGRDEIAELLNGVADGIRTGAVRLGSGDDAVSVGVAEELTLEIEFENEDDELNLELELEWSTPNEPAPTPPTENQSGEASKETTLVGAADGVTSLAQFELFQDRGKEWRWRLRHRNGNIIADSGEGYTQKHNAQKGLRSVVENSPAAETH